MSTIAVPARPAPALADESDWWATRGGHPAPEPYPEGGETCTRCGRDTLRRVTPTTEACVNPDCGPT